MTGRVVNEGGQPLPEATVIAVPAGTWSSQGQASYLSYPSSLTDDQGRFSLDGITGGLYEVTALVPGYYAEREAAGQRRLFRPGESVLIRMIRGGVIAGVVTTSSGEAIVGIHVRAIRLRTLEGKPALSTTLLTTSYLRTDDRGAYRIYGLEPGVYVVSAGGKAVLPISVTGYEGDSPTYYPSGTRDTATPLTLHAGQELMGIDIRYRENRGYVISGKVTGVTGGILGGGLVVLSQAPGGSVETISFLVPTEGAGEGQFAFSAVSDGEYDVSAMSVENSGTTSAAAPKRVKVKGADVTGVDLALTPLGSISGRVVLEPAPPADPKGGCKAGASESIEDIVILAQPEDRTKRKLAGAKSIMSLSPFSLHIDAVPDSNGSFTVRALHGGRYQLETRLPSENWWVASISRPPANASQRRPDVARSGISLKSGEKLEGLNLAIAQGAAGLRGKVVSSQENVALPGKLRLHLAPAEPERVDDPLRYAESLVEADGSFAISNLAPGRYKVFARIVSDDEANDEDELRAAAWDATTRALLRIEGEASDVVVELKRCERVTDYVYRYRAPAAKR
ncbi:MAG TPA: carboxypeptidase-like regulatory domain-containing protein [Blastocatellia bacterium]|nr:carboxypeptidase-like regulatory domain-containing protein [Blastocatellia bacterium]